MIPKEWLTHQITIQDVEGITRLDYIRHTLPFPIEEKDILDKNSWYQESVFARDARWNVLKAKLLASDELWEYKTTRTAMWSTITGSRGYCIVRNNEIIHYMPIGG